MSTSATENQANRRVLLKVPHSLSQQCVCRNYGFCMFYWVYLSRPSHSASSYQHSDHHYQQSVRYTQSGHLSFSCFCFEKLEPDTGWQPLLFTQLEGHGDCSENMTRHTGRQYGGRLGPLISQLSAPPSRLETQQSIRFTGPYLSNLRFTWWFGWETRKSGQGIGTDILLGERRRSWGKTTWVTFHRAVFWCQNSLE